MGSKIFAAAFFSLLFLASGEPALSDFTERQLDALAGRVGRTYWSAEAKESFEIVDLLRGPRPRYRVRFASGKESEIAIDAFLEQLNATILQQDPAAKERLKSAREAAEESRRQERIRAKPWPEQVKEAAAKGQVILGMTMSEARNTLGKPSRVVKIKQGNPLLGDQQQWIYQTGPALTFTNGLLTRIQKQEPKEN